MEQELKKEEKAPSELEQAYNVFQSSIPRINYITATLDRNSLMRVFTTVAAFPFIEKAPKIKGKLEQELFVLTLGVLNAKVTIMNSIDKKVLEDKLTEKILNEIPKEENDGESKMA